MGPELLILIPFFAIAIALISVGVVGIISNYFGDRI